MNYREQDIANLFVDFILDASNGWETIRQSCEGNEQHLPAISLFKHWKENQVFFSVKNMGEKLDTSVVVLFFFTDPDLYFINQPKFTDQFNQKDREIILVVDEASQFSESLRFFYARSKRSTRLHFLCLNNERNTSLKTNILKFASVHYQKPLYAFVTAVEKKIFARNTEWFNAFKEIIYPAFIEYRRPFINPQFIPDPHDLTFGARVAALRVVKMLKSILPRWALAPCWTLDDFKVFVTDLMQLFIYARNLAITNKVCKSLRNIFADFALECSHLQDFGDKMQYINTKFEVEIFPQFFELDKKILADITKNALKFLNSHFDLNKELNLFVYPCSSTIMTLLATLKSFTKVRYRFLYFDEYEKQRVFLHYKDYATRENTISIEDFSGFLDQINSNDLDCQKLFMLGTKSLLNTGTSALVLKGGDEIIQSAQTGHCKVLVISEGCKVERREIFKKILDEQRAEEQKVEENLKLLEEIGLPSPPLSFSFLSEYQKIDLLPEYFILTEESVFSLQTAGFAEFLKQAANKNQLMYPRYSIKAN